MSSSRTGTAACRMIGPASRSSSTKCTVQPVILTPCSQRLVLRIQPGKRRQQRRVDVQDPIRKLADEAARSAGA